VPPASKDTPDYALYAQDKPKDNTIVYAPDAVPSEFQKYARPDDHVIIMAPETARNAAVLVTKESRPSAALAKPFGCGPDPFRMEFSVAELQELLKYARDDPESSPAHHLWNFALRLRADDGGAALCDEAIQTDLIGMLQEWYLSEAAVEHYVPGFIGSLTERTACGGDTSPLLQPWEGCFSVLYELCRHRKGCHAFALAFIGKQPDGVTKRACPLLDTLSRLVYALSDVGRRPSKEEDMCNCHQGSGVMAGTRSSIEQAVLDTIGRALSGLDDDRSLRKRFAKAVKASKVRDTVITKVRAVKKSKWTDLAGTAEKLSHMLDGAISGKLGSTATPVESPEVPVTVKGGSSASKAKGALVPKGGGGGGAPWAGLYRMERNVCQPGAIGPKELLMSRLKVGPPADYATAENPQSETRLRAEAELERLTGHRVQATSDGDLEIADAPRGLPLPPKPPGAASRSPTA